MFPRVIRILCAALALAILTTASQAVDFCNGVMTAVPVKDGKPPVIDGNLDDWDLSTQEPCFISTQTADSMNAEWAVMYDNDALYLSAKVTMPGRGIYNPYNPQDGFWWGDILQVRMSSDPALQYPLDRKRDEASTRVLHLSFWQNHMTGKSFVNINRGTNLKNGETTMPPGAEVCIKDNGKTGYVMEAKLPWSVLDVPDGKNPFKAGEGAAFTAETLWIGGDKARTILCYRRNPGVFAFHSPDAWGKIIYTDKSPGKRVRPTMAQVVTEAKAAANVEAPKVGVPFEINVPDDGLKVSVNILDENGGVLREVMGGEAHPKGKLEVRWDGRDAFEKPLAPGSYKWGAYFHKPLVADYQGGVGSSGNPFYQTLDGKGAWGGDHTDPIDAASDAESLYLLWPVGEAGQPLVKTDLEGKVIWRAKPFVGGGFGPFYSVATDGKYVFLARGSDQDSLMPDLTKGETTANLCRSDAKTGALLTWTEGGPAEIPIFKVGYQLVPKDSTPLGYNANTKKGAAPYPEGMVRQPDCVGLAARDGKVFMSSYGLSKIFILDAETGKTTGELDCPSPRGLALNAAGDLFAVSYIPGKTAQVVRFAKAAGAAMPVITSGLEAPYDVAVSKDGQLAVSDLGKSQQVKIFSASGKLVKALGSKGGRAWQGTYNPAALSFLNPAGLTIDSQGALVLAECSTPKVFSRIALSSGKLLNRWYGPGVYWNATWPMPDDARNVFYLTSEDEEKGAVARANVAGEGKTGVPNAYWSLNMAGYEQVGSVADGIPQPEVLKAANGETYFVKDTRKHPICLLKNEIMRPVATWQSISAREKTNTLKRPYIEVWIDRNGDGKVQDNEKAQLADLSDGKPVPEINSTTSSLHMEPSGDLYFTTQYNSILKVPAKGFSKDGRIDWDLTKASLAVPQVAPGLDRMSTTYREGLLGVRLDKKGNIYTLFNTRLKGGTGAFDYVDAAAANRMCEGMGHTSRFNIIKMAKFSPEGKPLWFVGRKATAGAGPGEIYHFWNMAGLVNDSYIVGGSEWGQIYFYTQDGFFVDALMNNPGEVTPAGPYTFGGETSGGRVAYFPKTGELWAYSTGMTYKVKGFSKGAVEGESRTSGVVQLDKHYDLPTDVAAVAAAPLQVVALQGEPLTSDASWKDVPVSVVNKGGKPLARAQLGYDKAFLYARIAVTDDSPLENGATDEQLVFKQGDTAGIVLGPKREGDKVGAGDVRLMAVNLRGQPKLIAMKAVTQGEKKPFEYYTPSAGKWTFEFVGEVPGSQVKLEKTADGYLATFAVPLAFLEFKFAPGEGIRGDVEVRLSGAGQRGLQATSRNYLFTPSKAETTMTDDVPTEARMYPQYWGAVEVK